MSIFDPASFHDPEPVPNELSSAVIFQRTTRRLFLKCGFHREHLKGFKLTSPDIGTGIMTVTIQKPDDPEQSMEYEKFLKMLAHVRDIANGFSVIDSDICEELDDDDDYNDLSILYLPDEYRISGNFSEFMAALINYLSIHHGEEVSGYEDDFSFNRTHSYVQRCFNMAYSYIPH